jgi:hypothetical protein
MKGAGMDARQVQETRLQAVQRLRARKRPATLRTHPHQGFGHTDLVSEVVEGSEYTEAQSLGEWLDDREAGQPWTGEFTGTIYEAAEAARISERAAVAEVIRHARQLTAWDQWHAYETLCQWHNAARIPAARELMSALISAWEDRRSKLATERPEFSELADLPSPPAPRVLEYPTPYGIPAGQLGWS